MKANEAPKRLIMTRKEEILNYANSFKGKGADSEELKEVIRLAIIDGATWADANPKWKPSDEQIKALEVAIKSELMTGFQERALTSLLEQLRAL